MIQTAILGFGTVGSGVAEVLSDNAEAVAKRAGEAICVKYILDLREFPDSPFADRVIHDFDVIEADPEIRLVAECMGGVGAALNFTRRCLAAGKHVVTSNKELVATHGQELLALAAAHGCSYLFEASVGGGIPVLRPLTDDLGGNEITDICGILNGTTNFILTKMEREGATFESALKQAQLLGYAEANPEADVEGYDACRKTAILADLAYGNQVAPERVPTRGITDLTAADSAFAAAAGMRIKLIGRAKKLENGICCYVSPHLLPADHRLAQIDDVFNGVLIHGNAVDDVLFVGSGAGKRPTASAVVGDLIDCARHLERHKPIEWSAEPATLVDPKELPMRWFVRATVGAPLPGERIPAENSGECACITDPMSRKALDALNLEPLCVLPVLE